MDSFDNIAYQSCKKWIADKINDGYTWDDIFNMCVKVQDSESKLKDMIEKELWPEDLTLSLWEKFVSYYKKEHVQFRKFGDQKVIAIDNGAPNNNYTYLEGPASTWEQFKKFLAKSLGEVSINNIQNSCIWILQHLSNDTRKFGTVKGLVMGSVQSGKTVNMEGLVSIAADHDWNFFIVLSGTIDILRKQTRDRFKADLRTSEGILWRILDFTSEDKHFSAEELKLNSLEGTRNFSQRYLTVCLKNKSRLEHLINWLYKDPKRTSKLRIIVIDDEADQASINTAEITPDEVQERCAINQLIMNLVNGRMCDGTEPTIGFQAMNYISYTATPYANVLNESGNDSLYPKDFICTLPEANEYFGAKVIFGNSEQNYPGFDIIREISISEEQYLRKLRSDILIGIPEALRKSISWFLCSCAILRLSGHKKSISMLIHTSAVQRDHFAVYAAIGNWLNNTLEVLTHCEAVYSDEKTRVSVDDLSEANPDYSLLDSVNKNSPGFEEIRPELIVLLAEVVNIKFDEEGDLRYSSGIHLCVDNCSAKKMAEQGTYLRIVYPSEKQLVKMIKAPVFLVIGGNTLSRGLTIDGLVCTYFSRNSNQADTLMQMARWFGYRKGYELLQRIWMSQSVQQKFAALSKIDMDLKEEVALFMERGIAPSQFGPRIRNIPEIVKFRITSKKKSQMAEYADFDFYGDSYETTDFEDNEYLHKNIMLTEKMIASLVMISRPRRSTTANAIVWDNIDYRLLYNDFLRKFFISGFSSLSRNLDYLHDWIEKMNIDGKLLRWNVALIDGENKSEPWVIGQQVSVGSIERTKKAGKAHIDIGSLRSGRDAICDVDETSLSLGQAADLKATRKNGKDIISRRGQFNLEDKPLLLIYRIKRDGGIPRTQCREKMNSSHDIIGISIIVSGDSIGESHAKSLRIKI